MNDLSYAYFGRKDKSSTQHEGVVCVGYDLANDKESVEFSVAFCSPSDAFSKKKARSILRGRFNKGQSVEVATGVVTEKYKDYELAVDAIKAHIVDTVNGVEETELEYARFKGTVANVHVPRWFTDKLLSV